MVIKIYLCGMKQDGRNLSKEVQMEIRHKAVLHWQKHGNMQQTSELFGVSYPAMRKWVSLFKRNGKTALKSDRRGRPKGRELSRDKASTIIRKISDRTPEQLKLPFGLWTRENVGALLLREFGIKRSVWQIGRYLNEWGFTPQKPIYKAYEQQGEAVAKWLNELYPLIKRRARREKAMIFWGDETGVCSHDSRGRSFAPAGKTPVMRKTGRRFSVTMISAVNNRGKLYFMICNGAVNSDRFITFLKRLIRSRNEKVFLIIDNLPAHKTNRVKQWAKDNAHAIRLFYLPPYSPELNPDEYLNQDLKVSITGKISMKNTDDLKNGVMKFMQKRKRNPKQVEKYFHHPKVKYAA